MTSGLHNPSLALGLHGWRDLQLRQDLQGQHGLQHLTAGRWHCSLLANELLELRNATPPWPILEAHPAVLGVLNVRGQIVPVLDLAGLLQTMPQLLGDDDAHSGQQQPQAVANVSGLASPAPALYAMVQAPARLLALRVQAAGAALGRSAPRLNLQGVADLLRLPVPQRPPALATQRMATADVD